MQFDPHTLTNADVFRGNAQQICVYNSPDLQVWWTNLGDGRVLVEERVPDLTAMIEANKAEANAFSRTQKLRDFQQVASVPAALLTQWEQESGGDKEYIKRKLNDPDNAAFRTNGLRL